MDTLAVLLFALALNMDALGTGVSYGMRKISIPFPSLLIISLMSAVAVAVSMTAGNILSRLISPSIAPRLGGMILLVIGAWILVQSVCERFKKDPGVYCGKPIVNVKIRSLGLAIKVLREPSLADLDHSGAISPKEALLLGSALAMDALGVGFAVSMMGYNPIMTSAVVGIGHIALTYTGIFLGRYCTASSFGQQVTLLPGCILMILGIYKIC